MLTFDVGETVICSVEIKDDAGAYKNPATSTTISIDQLSPVYKVDVVASTNMTNDSTGKYHYDFDSAGIQAGTYRVNFRAADGLRITQTKENFTLV